MDFFRKRLWLLALAAALSVAAVIAWQTWRPVTEQNNYQTVPAERGRLLANVGATGTVRGQQSADLVWQTTGRVALVNVTLGQAVEAETVLAELATSSLPQGILLAESDLVAARQNLESLTISNLSLAQAQQALVDARQTAEDAQAAYDRLNRARVSDELIENTEDEIAQLKRQLKFQEWIFDRFFADKYDGHPGKAEQIINLTKTRERLNALIAKQNWYTNPPTALEIEKSQAVLRLAQARLADAQREVERFTEGRNLAEIAAAQASVEAAQATLNLSKVIAPFDGVITAAQVLPGDLVTSGGLAFRLENLERLYIDLQVSEIDINSLATGQPVTIVFDAIPEKTYTGQVVKINLVGEALNGAVNFPVTVELADPDERVKPGMTAAVTVTVREVAEALLVPNRAVRTVAGERIVYVLKDGQPVAVRIRLGAVAEAYSECVGGELQVGDLIILNPPAITPEASDQ